MTDSMEKADMVNSPPHYNAYSIEVIEVTRHCSFNIGNAIKYMLRHLHKGTSQQDLEKALWYINDHVNHKHGYDGTPLIDSDEAQGKLRVLASEYADQEGMIPDIGASLALLSISRIELAATALETALQTYDGTTG